MRVWDLIEGETPRLIATTGAMDIGSYQGPPPEGRVPAAPSRVIRLIPKRLVLAVSVVNHECHGKTCKREVIRPN